MARCAYCQMTYSSKVLKIHESSCPSKNNKQIKEANEINIEDATKRDLIMYILSETDGWNEKDLSRMLKKDLVLIASTE